MSRISTTQNKLLALYYQTLKLRTYEWPKHSTNIETSTYVDKILLLEGYKNETIYRDLIKPLRYRTIHVKPIFHNYKEMSSSVMGVSLPENIHVPSMKPNLIKCPDTDFGLIRLPEKNDFIIFVRSEFCEISILEQCLNEMKPISKGETSPRAGSASGFMIPSKQCKSLSNVTRNERILCIRNNSVGMSVAYRNKDGDVKGRNAIYNDLYMSRYTSKTKFSHALRSTAYQRLLISEMTSRLKAFILLDNCDVLPIHTTIFSFLKYDSERIEREKEFEAIGKSRLESKLLSWACTTGEMRNHQAVKSHYDGNKSHPVETMSLFGRLPVNMTTLTKEYVKNMEDGYLLLPVEGITLRLKCGYDLIHCSLKGTLHLADNSRNTCNWSRVHGP